MRFSVVALKDGGARCISVTNTKYAWQPVSNNHQTLPPGCLGLRYHKLTRKDPVHQTNLQTPTASSTRKRETYNIPVVSNIEYKQKLHRQHMPTRGT